MWHNEQDSTMAPHQYTPKTTALQVGMIVRFPVDTDEGHEEFRDYRIGRIERINDLESTATIKALVYGLQEDSKRNVAIVAVEHSFKCSLDHVMRCQILADSDFRHIKHSSIQGCVLTPCEEQFRDGTFREYFVEVGGNIQRMSETQLLIGSTRQDMNPLIQALNYELQNPSWKAPRDRVVEAYTELRNATFGIEDLVGSRVFLMAHQAEVIMRVLSSPECRFMLADEVGLGKTIEACVIFKALLRRDPKLQALIIAPASLTHQWRNELNKKFWLDLPIVHPGNGRVYLDDYPGVIVSAEVLAERENYWNILSKRQWGLVIVDEAHHLHKQKTLYQRVCQLSEAAERVLILTATPIQRRAAEYLSLLTILDPRRYKSESEASFKRLLDAQQPIRTAVILTSPLLDIKDVDAEEFIDELQPLARVLSDDATLMELLNQLADSEDDLGQVVELAREIIAYVSVNYRIESRTIRNRRASLPIDLPKRTLDTSYSYTSASAEEQVLEELYDYAYAYLQATSATPLALEYIRSLLHAAASSPNALAMLLNWRKDAFRNQSTSDTSGQSLIGPAAPRQIEQRLRQIMATAPTTPNDVRHLERLFAQVQEWQITSDHELATMRLSLMDKPSTNRLIECARAIYKTTDGRKTAKVLVFTGWTITANLLITRLRALLGVNAIAAFTAAMSDEELQSAADSFQSSDECCVLICDELGGEGRNFQMADLIIHVDIPWTPAQLEQRIGRVDRLGRIGEVLSAPIFARNTVEHHLFRLWDEGLQLFSSSMSGLEIALESTQNELMEALARSVREGIAAMLTPLKQKAHALREEVEKELLYDRAGDDKEFRQQFETISTKYRDGSVIRNAIHQWTSMAGLSNFRVQGDTMVYEARNFKLNAMIKARFLPPNMEEAARRLGNARTTQIVGTYNRDIAVKRENLVFFAPGDDPWTDAVITNALESDRGRCCAIGFRADSARGGSFFELLYSFQINPRPLYEKGLAPVYLLQAQTYLPRSYIRLLVSTDGKIIKQTDPRWQLTNQSFKVSPFVHLGKRGDSSKGTAQLDRFRERYPTDVWTELVESCVEVAEDHIKEDIVEYANELADTAQRAFQRRIAGWNAGIRWRGKNSQSTQVDPAMEEYRQAADALVAGIRNLNCRLESLCFWDVLEEAR